MKWSADSPLAKNFVCKRPWKLMLPVWAICLALSCAADSPSEVATTMPEAAASASCELADSPSLCVVGDACIACSLKTVTLNTTDQRRVHFQLPGRDAPAAGWPAVVLFQGSFYGGEAMWSSEAEAPFGMYRQVELIRNLLAAGFAVLTPETKGGGGTFWDTNVVDKWNDWEHTSDHRMMVALLDAITKGTFGLIDASRLYATGISSGGFMTSRMAVSYPGRFRALAIQSAGYATYPLGPLPVTLPATHPPTLFLHGKDDGLVPLDAMTTYAGRLEEDGVATERLVAETGHEWSPAAPTEIPAWFRLY